MRLLLLPFVLVVLAARAGASQLGTPVVPAGNPITPEKVLLGKALFWEEQLSSTGTMACGTCHNPIYGSSDGLSAHGNLGTHPGLDMSFGTADDARGSPGVVRNRVDGSYEPSSFFHFEPQVTRRKAPSAVNAAFFDEALLWDGRADGSFEDPLTGAVLLPSHAALESQAVQPLLDVVEMGSIGGDWSQVVARLVASTPMALATDVPPDLAAFVAGKSYPQLFEHAFGTPDVTPARIAMAIATYERILVSDRSPFDLGALAGLQMAGKALFETKANCAKCHPAPLFSDRLFHNTGVRPVAEDSGLQEVTLDPADAGKFKTPSLRNAAKRPRLFHNGSRQNLAEVVDFYDKGGDFSENLDPLIQPLGLTAPEKTALLAFLEGLTDSRVNEQLPPFDRPELYRFSSRQPTPNPSVPDTSVYGTAGSGGAVPDSIALEAPYVKNPSLTFAVGDALGGAPAFFGLATRAISNGIPVMGFLLFLDPSSTLCVTPVPLEGAAGVAGAGFGSLSLSLDLDPSFLGLDLYQQWFVLDPGAPGGIASSEGVLLRLF
jgi:cytochrome c peroxidase